LGKKRKRADWGGSTKEKVLKESKRFNTEKKKNVEEKKKKKFFSVTTFKGQEKGGAGGASPIRASLILQTKQRSCNRPTACDKKSASYETSRKLEKYKGRRLWGW